MPPTDHEQLREAVGLTLARRRGPTGHAQAVADATVETFREVAARLSPVVGDRGVDVLLRRALHLTSTAFPWLDLAQEEGDGAAPLTALHAHLATRDARSAADAGQALLVTFTELLATLIGTPLTRRLLAPVWAATDLEKPHE